MNGLPLVVHLEVFDFVLQLNRFGIIVTQGIEVVEVLLVDIPGDVHAVEHRTFKLLNIRIFRAHRLDQIVEITENQAIGANDLADLIHFAAMSDKFVGGRHIDTVHVRETNFRRG